MNTVVILLSWLLKWELYSEVYVKLLGRDSAHRFVLTLLNVFVNSRLNPFGLIIALDEQGQASGSLFWDDGDSIGKPGPLQWSSACIQGSPQATFSAAQWHWLLLDIAGELTPEWTTAYGFCCLFWYQSSLPCVLTDTIEKENYFLAKYTFSKVSGNIQGTCLHVGSCILV